MVWSCCFLSQKDVRLESVCCLLWLVLYGLDIWRHIMNGLLLIGSYLEARFRQTPLRVWVSLRDEEAHIGGWYSMMALGQWVLHFEKNQCLSYLRVVYVKFDLHILFVVISSLVFLFIKRGCTTTLGFFFLSFRVLTMWLFSWHVCFSRIW